MSWAGSRGVHCTYRSSYNTGLGIATGDVGGGEAHTAATRLLASPGATCRLCRRLWRRDAKACTACLRLRRGLAALVTPCTRASPGTGTGAGTGSCCHAGATSAGRVACHLFRLAVTKEGDLGSAPRGVG